MNVIQQKAIEETNRYYDIARKLYPQFKLNDPLIDFRLRGMTAGKAWLTKNKIQYQPVLLGDNAQDFLARTVPHEVAHIVAWEVFGDNGHGNGWKAVMRAFGVTDVTRCHSYDVSKVANQQKRIPYRCNCKVHQLSGIRASRLEKGITLYRCGLCGSTLEKVK